MKNLTFKLATLCCAILCSIATLASDFTYEKELIVTDLDIIETQMFLQFIGEDNEGTYMELNLFEKEYGEYPLILDENGEPKEWSIQGVYGRQTCVGGAVFSYSEEYHSDMLVADVYINALKVMYKITMYKPGVAPKDTIVCENMTKTVKKQYWSSNITLSGTHDTYGTVEFTINGSSGEYGRCASITGKIGSIKNLSGNGTWKATEDGLSEVLEAILANADASEVFKVYAYTIPTEPEPVDTIYINLPNAIFAEIDEELSITGTSEDAKSISLSLAGWKTIGLGAYEVGSLYGTINGVDVANMQKEATLTQNSNILTLTAVLDDAEYNV